MAGCRIVNQSVVDAVEKILTISESYKNAGEEFVKNLNSAIAEMEGDAKDALKKFVDGDVNDYVATQLPTAVKGMSELLEANRSNFESVDKQIADSISGS